MWQETKHGLFRQFNFRDIEQALNFINRIADIAIASKHYPRIETEWNVVQVWLYSSDSSQKISDVDELMSKQISDIFENITIKPVIKTSKNEENGNNNVPEEVKLFADGGSRGNPGPSSSGYVILTKDDEVLVDEGVYLGITTNNQAEYTALKLGLEKCLKLNIKKVHVYMDSLLVINQMKGIFKIKNRDLWPIHQSIKQLLNSFNSVSFQHVPREFNKLADSAVNRALDEKGL